MNYEQRVEIVAQVLRSTWDQHSQQKHGSMPLTPWADMPDHRRDKWRKMAIAAIETILS